MPQPQNQPESQEQRDREQRKRERLARLAQPRKSEQEAMAERAELPKSERFKRRQERIANVRAATATERVRVIPRDEALRKILKHPAAGAFRSEGSTEWPLDQFTKRRLREGDVTLEAQAEPQTRRAEPRPEAKPAEEPKPAS